KEILNELTQITQDYSFFFVIFVVFVKQKELNDIDICNDYSKKVVKINFKLSFMGEQIQILNDDICGIKFLLDGSKIISYSNEKTIRIWDNNDGKIVDLTEPSMVDYILRVDTQTGLSMK
ncbi:hypothetical protein RFI_31933, partial [Reticulomyxa filosa]